MKNKKEKKRRTAGEIFRPLGLFIERLGLIADFIVSLLLPRRRICTPLAGTCAENHKRDLTNGSREYINDQGRSTALGKLRFGDFSLNENGCGIISVYNALNSVGERASLADIADVFTRERINVDGAGKRGKYGTNPFSLRRGIKAFGFSCAKVPVRELKNDGLYIIGYFNRGRGFFSSAHFVALETRGGVTTAYNYSDSNAAVTVDTDVFRDGYIRGYRLEKQKSTLE